MRHQKLTVLLFSLVVFFQYCSKKDTGGGTVISPVKQPNLPATPYNYSNIVFPAHVLASLAVNDNTPPGNPITDNGATLGRVLFYDKNLSKNSTISCGSCHASDQSFTDPKRLSIGFEGGLTTRASMQLFNERFYRSGKMFWDERSNTLELQVLQPIQNHTEMGMTLTELVAKVSSLDYYPGLFTKAFGISVIDTVRISRALAQFVRSIVTYQAKYDRVKQGLEVFTPDEAAGENIFLTGGGATCAGCHTPPMFITSTPAAPFGLLDPADAGINNQNRFKSPSLRNIENSAPYFHNGNVATLDAVIGTGIPAHTIPPPDRPKLLAFLRTLTDNSFATDPKYVDPFK